MSLTPEQATAQLRAIGGALYADWDTLQTDIKNKSYGDVAKIEQDITTQQAALKQIETQLQTQLNNTPPGSAQDALSSVVQSVGLSMVFIARALGDLQTQDYTDALTNLQDVTGRGATGTAVDALRESMEWAEGQIQDAITNYDQTGNQTAANATQIQTMINSLVTYIGTMSPADAAGAFGITTGQLATYTTALTASSTDLKTIISAGGGPLSTQFLADWGTATGIITPPQAKPPT